MRSLRGGPGHPHVELARPVLDALRARPDAGLVSAASAGRHLFVGVSSIGADPSWTDRGTDRRFDDYWREFSFGVLEESAQ